MILEIEHHHLGYAQILNDCRTEEGGSVLMLCNAEADAMASARILSFLLRSDGISYQLMPCMSQLSMSSLIERVPHETVQALVLFNLGASINLTKLFGNLLQQHVKIYVMDCRRPVHLANIHAGENIVIFWDNNRGIEDNDIPSDGDILSGNESSSDEESASESDSDSDDSDDDSQSEGEAEFDDGASADARGDAAKKDIVKGEKQRKNTNIDGNDNDADADDDMNYQAETEDEDDNKSNHDDDSDDDDRGVGHAKSVQAKRRKLNISNEDGSDDDDDDVDQKAAKPTSATKDEDEDATMTTKDAATEPSDAQQSQDQSTTEDISPRERHQQRRNRVRKYYSSGSFYGTPVSYMTFRLATQMRFGSLGDLLWLACVGVTDAYLHSRLDVAVFVQLARDLDDNCRRLFPNDMYTRSAENVFAEDLLGESSAPANRASTKITFSDNGRILSQRDFKFFLLRHTSLYDSMICSDYVSTRLQIWTKRGRHQLQELLAKMGYPLDECQQPYPFMKPTLRRRLKEKLGEYAEEYGLEQFEFTSFFRVTGYQSLLAASDTAYAVTALLECDPPSTGGPYDEDKQALEAFNIAYDALNSNVAPNVTLNTLHGGGQDTSTLVNGGDLSGSAGLGAGIRLAMQMQKAILSSAVGLMERNGVTRLRHFRYAYLTCTSAGEHGGGGGHNNPQDPSMVDEEQHRQHHVFAKPLALCRLAQYLMNMNRENGAWTGTKSRPLILMAEKPQSKSFLVVGYEHQEKAGSFVKNKFGHFFQLTSESMNAAAKFDSFDSNVVEVDANDVQRFIEQLHYIMDSV